MADSDKRVGAKKSDPFLDSHAPDYPRGVRRPERNQPPREPIHTPMSDSDKRVEAAARVLYETAADSWDETWDEITKSARKEWRDRARAALAAADPPAGVAGDELRALRDKAFFVSVSADRPMEVQFEPVDGPGGGFVELAEAEAVLARAVALVRCERCGRVRASDDLAQPHSEPGETEPTCKGAFLPHGIGG